jgi:hypothetical protein
MIDIPSTISVEFKETIPTFSLVVIAAYSNFIFP